MSVLSIFHVYNLVYGDTKLPEKIGKGAASLPEGRGAGFGEQLE